jgi:hypothetical protein
MRSQPRRKNKLHKYKMANNSFDQIKTNLVRGYKLNTVSTVAVIQKVWGVVVTLNRKISDLWLSFC